MPETSEPAAHRGASAARSAVRFVLVEPRIEGNVGGAARALKNLGFANLVVVAPRCDPRGDDARRMAHDACDLLEDVTELPDLDAALDGTVAAIGTSRRRGKQRRPHWRLDQLAPEMARLASGGEIAIVFGRETRGLTDAELDRCTHLVHFPAADSYPSFNLAQSVLLVAYELCLALPDAEAGAPVALDPPADHATREAMYAHLESALEAIGFLHADSAEPMMRRIRRLLGRAELTATEARILRGIARQVLWLSRQARPAPPERDGGA
jgi:TrmH family RNA methyltransferase